MSNNSVDSDDIKNDDEESLQTGGTLDYYHEEQSRKAVSNLFNSNKETPETAAPAEAPPAQNAGGFVKGYKEKSDDDKMQDSEEIRLDINARNERSVEAEPEDSDDINYSSYRRKPREPIPQPNPAVRVHHSKSSPSEEPAQERGATGRSRPTGPPERQNQSQYSKRVRNNETSDNFSGEEYSRSKKRYDEREGAYAPAGRGTGPQRAGSPGMRDTPYRAGSAVARKNPSREDIEDYDDLSGNRQLIQIITGAVALVLLIVLIFLIMRINSLSRDLKTANANLEEAMADASGDFYKSEYERVDRELKTAQERIVVLETAAQAADNDDSGFDSQGQNQQSGTGAQSGTAQSGGASTGQTTYTVEKGDSISRIAQRFYGSSSKANIDKIMDANNMTSDRINIGDKLTIPE